MEKDKIIELVQEMIDKSLEAFLNKLVEREKDKIPDEKECCIKKPKEKPEVIYRYIKGATCKDRMRLLSYGFNSLAVDILTEEDEIENQKIIEYIKNTPILCLPNLKIVDACPLKKE
jgi:hypothetical protein